MDQDNINKGETDNSTGVEFQEEYQANSSYISNTSKMIGWVIDYSGGLVKDERGASYVLFGAIILLIMISVFLLFSFSGTEVRDGGSGPSEEELREYRRIQPF